MNRFFKINILLILIMTSSCTDKYYSGRHFSLTYFDFIYSPKMDSLSLPIPVGGYSEFSKRFFDYYYKLTPEEATYHGLTPEDANMQNSMFYFDLYIDKKGVLIKVFTCNSNKKNCKDKKAILAIQKIKYWEPAKFKGKNVNCRFRMPYRIHLE
jgi:hypothetical protein